MAAVNRRSRVLEGECLECLVECFEEAYASEPQRYKNTACTACFGPLLAPVAVVERATWEAQFQLAAWNELGRDFPCRAAALLSDCCRHCRAAACIVFMFLAARQRCMCDAVLQSALPRSSSPL
eukprot:jgi/Tetstr1/420695/TSEL_011780.t1